VEKVMALYNSDLLYTTRFMEYVNKKKELNIRISAFTKEESLKEYLHNNSVDILVLGDEILTEELSHHNIKYIYRLSDNPQKEAVMDQPQIFKYQSAMMVMKEILSDYMEKEGKVKAVSNLSQVRITSIFTPISGAEKLNFVWALSSLMTQHSKVLLVILEPFPVVMLPHSTNNQGLTEFIYYLKENFNIEKMRSLLTQSGSLYILSGVIHGADLLSLSREDIQKWLEELRKTADYQNVIFYLGCYSEAIIELINLSDRVLAVSLSNTFETAVLKEWEKQMNRSGVDTAQERIRYVRLQRQSDFEAMPNTLQELMNSSSWTEAEQYLNL
jgi:hypothetical protein